MTDPLSLYDVVRANNQQTGTNVQQLQQFTITQQSALVNYNPGWVCRYPIADVSYPEVFNATLGTAFSTGAASAGTAHTHPAGSIQARTWSATCVSGDSWGAWLTITSDIVMDTVAMHIIKDAGTLNNTFLEIFQENSDLSLTRVFSQDVSANITTTTTWVEIAITGGLLVARGTRYMVRVRNKSTVATSVHVYGVLAQNLLTAARQCFYTPAGGGITDNTSYTAAQAAASAPTDVIAFAMLGVTTANTSPVSYADDFNRNSPGYLGRTWTQKSNTGGGANNLGCVNDRCEFGGTTNGDEAAVFSSACNTDGIRVDGRFYNTFGNAAPSGLIICSNVDMTNAAFLLVTGSSATIYSGAWNSLTSRATISTSGNNDSIWSIYYTAATNTYTVLQDGIDVGLTWVDTGNVVSHGIGVRYGGIRISRVAGVNGAAIDNWNMRDYS